jgi:hypothetical protein
MTTTNNFSWLPSLAISTSSHSTWIGASTVNFIACPARATTSTGIPDIFAFGAAAPATTSSTPNYTVIDNFGI